MLFVLDCSVTMSWLFADEGDETTEQLLESLLTDGALVPSLWHIEVSNAILVATRRGRLKESDWPRIQSNLAGLPLAVDTETHERALEVILPLAHRHELSVYDAVYLELALRKNLPLATLDDGLHRACEQAGVRQGPLSGV